MTATVLGESWCNAERVADAAHRCGKRKGGPPDAIAFRMRQGEEVVSLARRLALGTYVPQPGRVFVTERPKHREVHAFRTGTGEISMNANPLRLVSVLAAVAMALAAPAGAATAPAGRYTYPAAGTVYDTKTKLTWQQTAPSAAYAWADAKTYCAGVGATLGGTGWRLPTMKELQTIVDESRSNPSIDPTAFPGAPAAIFWSSSPVAGSPSYAWSVYFYVGNTDYGWATAHTLDVRCVR
jgi:Protein of unknown function (DUF1566)